MCGWGRGSQPLCLEEEDIKVICNSAFIGVSCLEQMEALTPTPSLAWTPEHHTEVPSPP